MKPYNTVRIRQAGFSLIELMVAAAIGLLLLTGLSLIFLNSSEANRELQKTSQQIENGRYAVDLLTQNIHHSGFYGHLYVLPSVPATAPDPCEIANATALYDALSLPMQGYRAANLSTRADISSTSCGTLLSSANLKPGSDVLVVRRALTNVLSVGSVAASNEVYIQANGTTGEVQFGNGAALVAGKKANGSAATLFLKNGTTAAPIRKYVVHVYFVALCSVGSGTNGVCQSTDDAIPTLKRLELVAGATGAKMSIVPLVEGIEYLKVEYGVDNSPAVNAVTGLVGDGTVDSYTATPATPSDWSTVITAKVFVLARNNEATTGYTDVKSYTLGSASVPASNDPFKRHAYAVTVRGNNPADRREIP